MHANYLMKKQDPSEKARRKNAIAMPNKKP
jgi:hypothetical protein